MGIKALSPQLAMNILLLGLHLLMTSQLLKSRYENKKTLQFRQLVLVQLNVFNFTKICINLFSFAQI